MALVNFGVAAVSRVSGEPEAQLLDLRCECGSAGCRERVRIARSEYEAAAATGAPIVAPEHASGPDPGHVTPTT
ncbi:MAG TPA: hypothetical protein VJQ85_08930 [Gaiellaceae bacterium]|nr:hypothetical protein [Gaiellaceae bacterium]